MAQKRMFSIDVVDTDKFLDMSVTAQALYFHLGMHGDDDGFVSSPKKIARSAGCNDDDLRLLASKGFIIPFESGVIVITDWKRNNTLKNDRYKATIYQEEKAQLQEDGAGKYILGSNVVPCVIQNGSNLEPEHNITEHNITKYRKDKADKPPSRSRFTPPTVEEVRNYCQERNNGIDPERFVAYYTANGWVQSKGKPIKDWKACVITWEKNNQQGSTPLSKAGYIPPNDDPGNWMEG